MNVNNKLEYLMKVFVVYFMLFSLFTQLDAKVCVKIPWPIYGHIEDCKTV